MLIGTQECFFKKKSIIKNFKKFQNKVFKNCLKSVNKSKFKNDIYYLNKNDFLKSAHQYLLIMQF